MTDIFTVQVLSVFSFLLIVSVWYNTRHADYQPPEGILEIVLLASFVEKSLGEKIEPRWFLKSEDAKKVIDETKLPARVKRFLQQYSRYGRWGYLTEKDLIPSDDVSLGPISGFLAAAIVGLLLFFVAPIIPTLLFVKEEDRDFSSVAIVHPLERSQILLQLFGVVFSIVIWMSLIYVWLEGTARLAILAILALLLLVPTFNIARTIVWQNRWKNFWALKLTRILCDAAHRNDHDLYNRAFQLKTSVDDQPVVPLTGVQRAIIVIFTLAQIVFTQAAPLVSGLWRGLFA